MHVRMCVYIYIIGIGLVRLDWIRLKIVCVCLCGWACMELPTARADVLCKLSPSFAPESTHACNGQYDHSMMTLETP